MRQTLMVLVRLLAVSLLPTLLFAQSPPEARNQNDSPPPAASPQTSDSVVQRPSITPLTINDGSAGLIDLNGSTAPYTTSGVLAQATTTAKPNVSVKTGTADGTSTFTVFNSANTQLFSVTGIGRVGIGTQAPETELHIVSASSNALRGIVYDEINDTSGGLITVRKARGTLAAPTSAQNGDPIASFNAQAYDGASWLQTGRLRFVADATASAGHVPTSFQLWTGDGASTTERLRVTSAGFLGLGTTAPGAPLHINASRTQSQLYISDDVTPTSGLLSALTYFTDNVSLGFDVAWYSGWVARNPSVAWLWKAGGKLRFVGSAGNTPNTCCATANIYQDIDLATGTSTFLSPSVPNTSTAITGGTIQLGGYPTKVTFGNGQFIQDNAGGNLRIFGGFDLRMDTSTGDIVIAPGSTQTRVTGNLSATTSMTVGTTNGDQTTRLTVHGGVVVDGNIAAKYQDVAEWVPATEGMEPGTVVVLNRERSNEVMPSSDAYDTGVAGVVSEQPGVILGEAASSKAKIATTGRVKVRVTTAKGAIRVGDLLVTSDRPGVAMRSEPIDVGGVKIHRPGTLIGKALEPLASGQGEILVLLSLQ